MSLYKDYKTLRGMRKAIKAERKENDRCRNCGKRERCEDWCWGPRLSHYAKFILANWRNPVQATTLAWHFYKDNLYWAGVEPWHRY